MSRVDLWRATGRRVLSPEPPCRPSEECRHRTGPSMAAVMHGHRRTEPEGSSAWYLTRWERNEGDHLKAGGQDLLDSRATREEDYRRRMIQTFCSDSTVWRRVLGISFGFQATRERIIGEDDAGEWFRRWFKPFAVIVLYLYIYISRTRTVIWDGMAFDTGRGREISNDMSDA